MSGWRLRWTAFAILAAMVLLVLGLTGRELGRLERAELQARAEAEHHEAVRLALWRLDSWIGPRLAREAGRPYFEYLSFYPPERAYTRVLGRIRPGEIITPSPLLTERDPIVRLHVQVRGDGTVSSPQVPRGNELDLSQATLVAAEEIAERERDLASIAEVLPPLEELWAMVEPPNGGSEDGARVAAGEPGESGAAGAAGTSQYADGAGLAGQAATNQVERSIRESSRRAESIAEQAEWVETRTAVTRPPGAEKLDGAPPAPVVRVGAFRAVWVGEDPAAEPTLMLLRGVEAEGDRLVQGVVLDWARLRTDLGNQIVDLLPAATLRPVDRVAGAGTDASDERSAARTLAAVPVRLDVAMPTAVTQGTLAWIGSPKGRTLLVAWVMAAGALLAVAATLRASYAWADRRDRFASAVTHELRTPLTTFRMYAEMLDEGMVRGEDQRASYISTLRGEADRLGDLVENVLAFARLERGSEGRASAAGATPMAAGELLDRILPDQERRAARLELPLQVSREAGVDAAIVRAEPESIAQVIANLLDNASKYGRGSNGEPVRLTLHREAGGDGDGDGGGAGAVVLDVQDAGPGVPPSERRRIFRPFHRGGEEAVHGRTGVGLGLALSRELMRRQGGDLQIVTAANGDARRGACFRLRFAAEA